MSRRRSWIGSSAAALSLILSACSGGEGGTTQPQTTGSIAGDVRASGSGVAGAQIALTGGATRNVTTSASGQYQFDDLVPGSYSVAVGLPLGFEFAAGQSATQSAQVQAGQTTRIDWELRSQSTGGPVQVVRLSGMSFSPGTVTITRGTTVRWINDEGVHTVTPDNATQAGVWTGTGLLNPGQQFEFTFNTAGTYNYHCVPHRAVMTGTIVVQ